MAKISNVMATKIALDLVDASKSVRNLTTEVNASTKAWQAQEASLRSAGDYAGAAKARDDRAIDPLQFVRGRRADNG